MPHKLYLTHDAKNAAEPAVVADAATRAIDAVFGRRFKLHSFGGHDIREPYVAVEFLLANGVSFIATLVDTDLWEIEKMPIGPGPRAKRVVLSDRAIGLVNAMGWQHDAVERSARLAALTISGDQPVTGFSIPVEVIDFRATLDRDGAIAVDLIDVNARAR
jgi:hypothetical protein